MNLKRTLLEQERKEWVVSSCLGMRGRVWSRQGMQPGPKMEITEQTGKMGAETLSCTVLVSAAGGSKS